MRTDELRHALDDLAGDDPAVDDGFVRVTKKVRRHRTRVWSGVAAACVAIVAVATVGVLRRDDDHKVTVVNPSPAVGNVADFKWTRVPAPAMTINRIVTVGGKTFALGSSPDGGPAIGQLDALGATTSLVDPTQTHLTVLPFDTSGSVNDLVSVPRGLIAVGTRGTGPDETAAAWRSTDGGHNWQAALIDTTRNDPSPSLNRVLVFDGTIYAIGTPSEKLSATRCPSNIWTSTDGVTFRPMWTPMVCAGPADAVNGPAGLLITTPGGGPPFGNATAWTKSGGQWSPHAIPTSTAGGNSWVGVVSGGDDGYVAVGSISSRSTSVGAIWWSPDGEEWKQVVTARGAVDPESSSAVFTGAAHSGAGWIAVGARGHRDETSTPLSDAMVWTSSDGEHWVESTRDGTDFEQFARANGVGTTANGFAVVGLPNMTAEKLGVESNEDQVLWMGSDPPPTTDGIAQGTMLITGGPLRATDTPVPGTIIATGTDRQQHTATVDANGRFAIDLPPGRYDVVGRSPRYDNGTAACQATPALVHANAVTRVAVYCPRF